MKVAIIGAGPAGLTAAYQLSKQKVEVDVYEAGSSVGGLAKSIHLWGQTVDLGPHRFFSSDTKVNSLWLEVVGKEYEMVNRLTRILYKNKFFHYPLKPANAFFNLGLIESVHCILRYGMERISPTKVDITFESWVKNRFGKRLFEIFFKTYSEKLWGISCKELNADFAAQRIKNLSLYEAIMNAFTGGKNNKHKTLVDQFAYPVKGSGYVYETMQELIKKNGGNIFLNTPIDRVMIENGVANGIQKKDGEIVKYDHIVSSMPITTLISRMPGTPAHILDVNKKLVFRNTIIVYLLIEAKDLFPDNWIYIHSTELQMGRLTNFRNWAPQLHGDSEETILALEYWCYNEDKLWNMESDDLIRLAQKEVRDTGLIKDAKISQGYVYKIPKCYPVYKTDYKDNLKPIENYLRTIKNISVIGRYGAFKYNNQDHSILMGLLVAENLLENKNHDLWEINTDYDNYQEASVITKSGLQKTEL